MATHLGSPLLPPSQRPLRPQTYSPPADTSDANSDDDSDDSGAATDRDVRAIRPATAGCCTPVAVLCVHISLSCIPTRPLGHHARPPAITVSRLALNVHRSPTHPTCFLARYSLFCLCTTGGSKTRTPAQPRVVLLCRTRPSNPLLPAHHPGAFNHPWLDDPVHKGRPDPVYNGRTTRSVCAYPEHTPLSIAPSVQPLIHVCTLPDCVCVMQISTSLDSKFGVFAHTV
jgi:hypothetical protein